MKQAADAPEVHRRLLNAHDEFVQQRRLEGPGGPYRITRPDAALGSVRLSWESGFGVIQRIRERKGLEPGIAKVGPQLIGRVPVRLHSVLVALVVGRCVEAETGGI